jgi:hypothetical protein
MGMRWAYPILLGVGLLLGGPPPAHGQFDPARISAGQVQDAADAAAKAIHLGEVDRAERIYRAILRARPDHDLAYRQLWTIDRVRGVADDPNQRRRLAGRFGEGWHLRQTEHYLLVYDAAHPWADTRASMLERTYDTFIKQFRAAGLRPRPLARRLGCVLFAEHAAFLDYAKRVDRLSAEWPAGYYSARTNRIVLFNYATSPQMQALVREMKELRSRVDRLSGATKRDSSAWSDLTVARRKLGRVERRYQIIGAWANIQQTIHEAVHQLAFNTGLQRRDVQYPMWFSEGLATCFETTHPAAPFGPAHDNPSRRRRLRQAYLRGELYALREFVAMDQPPEDAHAREIAYAQSWGLFHFLYDRRPDALRAYIGHMLLQPAGRRNEPTRVDDFTNAFGPIDRVTARWLGYAKKLSG